MSFLRSLLDKENRSALRLALFGLTFAFLGLLFSLFFGYLERSSKERLGEHQKVIRDVAMFASEELETSDTKKEIYPRQSIADLVGEMVSLVNQNGLKLLTIKPDEKEKLRVESREYQGLPVTVKMRGAFEDAYRFFHALEMLPTFIVEDGLVLEKADEASVVAEIRLVVPLKNQQP